MNDALGPRWCCPCGAVEAHADLVRRVGELYHRDCGGAVGPVPVSEEAQSRDT